MHLSPPALPHPAGSPWYLLDRRLCAQREQWKNIQYAISAADTHEHMHLEEVSKFGVKTGLLAPWSIRRLLSRFAIVFSDAFFNHVVSLIDQTEEGEVRGINGHHSATCPTEGVACALVSMQIPYTAFLAYFKKGARHEDCHAIKPVTGVSVPQAKRMVREMIENKLPTGPAPLQRCFQYFDQDGTCAPRG
jgi:hypothetical protein